jgi:hypothetical protein
MQGEHEESWIYARLTNWGHWARTRPLYGHCYSIEHRFRSPQHWNPPEPRIVVDVPQALEVERAMRHIPRRNHTALTCHFVYRLPARRCCQIVMIRFDLWGEILGDAMHMIENRLTIQIGRNNLLANSRKPMQPVEKTAP